MTDAWKEFCRDSDGASVAGYVERGAAPGTPGRWAVSFRDPSGTFALQPGDTPASMDTRSRRWLGAGPQRAMIGYVSFDAVSLFEPALRRSDPPSPFPLGEWAMIDRLRVHRHPGPGPKVRAPRPGPVPEPRSETLASAAFERATRRLHAAIGNGEAFQVVLATRRSWRRPGDLLRCAGRLRAREHFAYFYYLRFSDREILGASPESVLEVRGRRAFLTPIAGTRPRGAAERRRRPLRQDPKELAEHRMLVDLARNDLGRVCVPGTVRILWRERLERFARLEHLISRVAGRLRAEVGPWTALAAAFPAGTVSGAPKIRATQLLRAEERTWRGPYGGAIGVLRGTGEAAWPLAIRSAFAAADRLYTAAGAGIVWGSKPHREFRETRAKLAQVEAVTVGRGP